MICAKRQFSDSGKPLDWTCGLVLVS